MEPTQQLIDDIFRERVLRARSTQPAEKLLAGPRLFEEEWRIMKGSIREKFPDADEPQVHQILIERLDRIRQLEDRDLYRSLPV